MSMYSFVCNKEANMVYTRFMSCSCNVCRTRNIDNMITLCANKTTVGELVGRSLKKSDKKPYRKRRKTNNIPQGIGLE